MYAKLYGTASTIFKPIPIDPGQGKKTNFIDTVLHSDHPMDSLLEEARECYENSRRVRYILRTGTGHPGIIGLSEESIHAADPIGALKSLATDPIQEHNGWVTRFTDSDGLFALEVEHDQRLVSPCQSVYVVKKYLLERLSIPW